VHCVSSAREFSQRTDGRITNRVCKHSCDHHTASSLASGPGFVTFTVMSERVVDLRSSIWDRSEYGNPTCLRSEILSVALRITAGQEQAKRKGRRSGTDRPTVIRPVSGRKPAASRYEPPSLKNNCCGRRRNPFHFSRGYQSVMSTSRGVASGYFFLCFIAVFLRALRVLRGNKRSRSFHHGEHRGHGGSRGKAAIAAFFCFLYALLFKIRFPIHTPRVNSSSALSFADH